MCPPNVVLDRVQRDKFERPLTAIRLTETRLGAEERPSRPKPLSTTHVNDIGAEMGHRHSPYQRSAGGIWSHATASSSRTRVERDDQYQQVLWRARKSPHRAL